MDDLRLVAALGNERFEIVEGAGEGFYVFRYVNGQSTHDYLQDNIPAAKATAEEYWQVPTSAWRPAMPGELPLWQQASTRS